MRPVISPSSPDLPVWLARGLAGSSLAEPVAGDGPGRVRAAFGGASRDPAADAETLEWTSQYLQAEALRGRIEATRRRWPGGSGQRTGSGQRSGSEQPSDSGRPSASGRRSGLGLPPGLPDGPWLCGVPAPPVDTSRPPGAVFWAAARACAPVLLSARGDGEARPGGPSLTTELWLSAEAPLDVDAALDARLVTSTGSAVALLERPLRFRLDGSVLLGCLEADLDPAPQLLVLDLAARRPDGELLAANRYLLSTGPTLAPLLDLPAASVDGVVLSRSDRTSLVRVENVGRQLAPLVRLDRLCPAGRELVPDGWLPDDDWFSLLPGEWRLIRIEDRRQRFRRGGWPAEGDEGSRRPG